MIGETFEDGTGRKLKVTALEPSSVLGRDIQGRLTTEDGAETDYACDMPTFEAIWLRGETPPDNQTEGQP